jgi:hypothetical protein
MALCIEKPETKRPARELARATGESITEAMTHALRDRLLRETGHDTRAAFGIVPPPESRTPMSLRRVLLLASLALSLAALPASAQTVPCHLICSPRFTFQPGVLVKNAINPPATAAGDAPSTSDFLFRLVTVAPTTLPRTALSFALQWTPFADRNGFTSNAPGFTYGPVISLFSAGPLSTAVDVLGSYAPSRTSTASYRNELVLKFDVNLAAGSMLGPRAPAYLRKVGLYGFIAQQMSGLPRDADGDRVHAPVLMFGAVLPIAPLP